MKLKNQKETVFTSVETGEQFVQTTEKSYSIKTTSDEFYMTFFSAIQNLVGASGTDMKVLSKLCSISEYNTGVVYLPAQRRSEVCGELGVKPQTLTNSISSLRKKEFIEGSGGVFKINPKYHWKGETSVRDKILKGEIEITFNLRNTSDNFLTENE